MMDFSLYFNGYEAKAVHGTLGLVVVLLRRVTLRSYNGHGAKDVLGRVRLLHLLLAEVTFQYFIG